MGGKIATHRRPSGDSAKLRFEDVGFVTCSRDPSLGFCRVFQPEKRHQIQFRMWQWHHLEVVSVDLFDEMFRGAQCSAHGRKNFSHPKNTPFSLGRKPNNLKMFMKNPLHSLQVANSTPKIHFLKVCSLPNLCLTKIPSEKKKTKPSSCSPYQNQPPKKWVLANNQPPNLERQSTPQLDQKNWEALQLLDLPSYLEPNIILMNSVSWRNPNLLREVSVVGFGVV